MAKNRISEFSTTAALNTDIANIDIAEGCAPSGINNAIRELMAQLKDQQAGTDPDGNPTSANNFTVGGNLAVTGTTTATGAITATGGVVGAVTGNITGNITGNATGNLISVTNTITSGSFIVGNTFTILTLGTTDFTLIGASANTIGVRFTATGVGTGTGTATTFTGRAVNVTGTVAIANGGTGATSFTQNAVIVGNGVTSPTSVLPSTNGNVLASTVGATVTAGAFVVGTQYTILTVGTTDFTAVGASANTVGVVFTATGVGTGTGTATTNVWTSTANPLPAALSTASGTAPSYSARAWVNFNGTTNANLSGTYSQSGTTVTVTATAHGLIVGHVIFADITSGTGVDGTYTVTTVADANTFTYTAGTSLTTLGTITLPRRTIRASGNVSSITDNSVGNYTVNFTTAMVDANYSYVGTYDLSIAALSNSSGGINEVSRLAASLQFRTNHSAGTAEDSEVVCLQVFR